MATDSQPNLAAELAVRRQRQGVKLEAIAEELKSLGYANPRGRSWTGAEVARLLVGVSLAKAGQRQEAGTLACQRKPRG